MFNSNGPSWNCVCATVLWLGVVACMVAMFLPIHESLAWGTLGCALSAAAATLSIRGFFIRFAKREFDAFSLGRSVGQVEGENVRNLR